MIPLFPFLKRNGVFLVIVLASQLIIATFLTQFLLDSKNTLQNNVRWISTKPKLAVGIMGDVALMTHRQALQKNRLNLGAWHGFQELIYHKALPVQEIEFDVKLTPDSYFIFVFNKSEENFQGIRFSHYQIFDNIYFQADSGEQFLQRQNLSLLPLSAEKWHRVKITFNSQQLSLWVDGGLKEKINTALFDQQLFGFRGGYNNVMVDNVVIRIKGSSRVIKEDFENTQNALLYYLCIFLCNGLIAVVTAYRRNSKNIPLKHIQFTVLGIQGAVIICIGLYFAFDKIYNREFRYPKVDAAMQEEKDIKKTNWAKDFTEKLRREYTQKPTENIFRILFIGTSQTRGSGVNHEEDVFARVIEEKLNKDGFVGRRVECINTGVSGIQSSQIYDLYSRQWVSFNPKIVIINLSNNDRDKTLFASNLEKFILLNQEKNIKTIFVLEPNSIEHEPKELRLHQAMRDVAQRYHVPLVDMHSYLKSHYDDGILWWDRVHLTSFGHRMIADILTEEIKKLLNDKM